MGLIRNLLRPITSRFSMRMGLAVDRSQLKADVVQIRTALEQMSFAMQDTHRALDRIADRIDEACRRGDELQRDLYQISANIDTLTSMTATVTAHDERLQLSMDAIRLDHQASAARNHSLQIGVDALRLDQQSLSATISIGFNEAARRSEALSGQMTAVQVLSDLLMSRADAAVQRSFIPLGSEILMRVPEGMLLVPAEDSALVAAMWEARGRLEPGTLKVVTALLQEGDTVIDVGANIGLVTLPAARAVGPRGHVVAVEPAARIADLLSRSLFLNVGPERVTVHRLAAGEETGTAVLHVGATAGHSSLLPVSGSGRDEHVDVARLDDLIEPGRRIKLVKIDAEGFELAVWRGMRRILMENPELVVVVEFGPEHLERAGVAVDEWVDSFLAPGFLAFEIDEDNGRLEPLRPREDLQRVVSLNLLLLRHPATAYPMLAFA